ncbi:retrotransposon protein, putative, ty1-copia subclass [Tanacetum coccineum]
MVTGGVWSGEYIGHGFTKSVNELDMCYTMLQELHSMVIGGALVHKNYDGSKQEAIREGKIQKDKKKPRWAKGKDKGKNKLTYARKPKIPPPLKRDHPKKDFICHHYKDVGHWRRNCPYYQAELKKRKKASLASTSGIFTIELYAFPNKTWVYDTGCGTDIYNTLQYLRRSKKLKHGALSLYMGNGMRAAVEAIGNFDLILPSSLIIVLYNCHFTPTITRGIVLISRLVENGYINIFTTYGISISKDNVFYFNAIPHEGIYEIDMLNLYPNVSSTFNVSNKRVKYSLDSSYLWHCRLGHINKKRMDKLQHDRILETTYDESLEKCKSCIFGKMTRKPFSHQVERAKDLFGLTHTDVCGPFRTISRKGASYFITFTDDFNRYGYVYLIKHKHEVFETFKVFQNEVENQHGKKIKAIQSDRYGFYVDVDEYELGDLNEPPNYKAALSDPEYDKWLEAMNTEMQSMKDNQVWILVELFPNGRITRSKWIFKKKTDMDGNVHTFKARLVAKGYTQTYGVDYGGTFSPIADVRAIRILLAIAAFYDYEIWQMDIKTAFLNGHLSEDVYMVQPEGFVDLKHLTKYANFNVSFMD